MTLLDAFACPYCGGALLRESYTVRCGAEHRFVVRFGGPGRRAGGDGADPERPAAREDGFVLRVVSHPDRREVGRVHEFPLEGA